MLVKREKLSIVSEEEQREGDIPGKAIDYELIKNKEINFKGKIFKKNVLKMTFQLENGLTKTKEMIFTLKENTEFGRFVTAIKGFFPKSISDVEKELLNKSVTLEIKKNVKESKTYYNIVGFKHIERAEEDTINDEIEKFLEDEID